MRIFFLFLLATIFACCSLLIAAQQTPTSAWFFSHDVGPNDILASAASKPYPFFRPDGTQFVVQMISSESAGSAFICLMNAIGNSQKCDVILYNTDNSFYALTHVDLIKTLNYNQTGVLLVQILSLNFNRVRFLGIDLDSYKVVINYQLPSAYQYVSDPYAKIYGVIRNDDYTVAAPAAIVLTAPDSNYDFENIVCLNGTYPFNTIWKTRIPIPQMYASYGYTYARDFTFSDFGPGNSRMIVFAQLDNIYFLDLHTGQIVPNPGAVSGSNTTVPNPFSASLSCNLPSQIDPSVINHLALRRIFASRTEIFLMFGNTNYSYNNNTLTNFFFCGITVETPQLNPFIQYVYNASIDLVKGPASVEASIVQVGSNQITILSVAGQPFPADATNAATLYVFSLFGRNYSSNPTAQLNFAIPQRNPNSEAFNLPIPVLGKDGFSTIGVSKGYVFQGLDPMTGQTKWTCPGAFPTNSLNAAVVR
jgi:hypothetical protein